MAGRAGRRGKDVEGHVFYLPSREPISMGEMREMMTGRKTPIDSKMDFHYEFLLKTALNQGLDWTHIMEKSYWSQQRRLELENMQVELDMLLQEQAALGLDPKTLTDCRERESLEQILKSAVNAAKKKAQQALESWKNSHMGALWDLLWKRWGSYKPSHTWKTTKVLLRRNSHSWSAVDLWRTESQPSVVFSQRR
jgi:superfamily II RNA helicase